MPAQGFVVSDDSIEVAELRLGDVLYRACPRLRFHVSYDAEDTLFDLEGDFEISLSAGSRAELVRELDEVLAMLWQDYAQETPIGSRRRLAFSAPSFSAGSRLPKWAPFHRLLANRRCLRRWR